MVLCEGLGHTPAFAANRSFCPSQRERVVYTNFSTTEIIVKQLAVHYGRYIDAVTLCGNFAQTVVPR